MNQRGDLQPPPRGCVLKRADKQAPLQTYLQPPPRGCVLKPTMPKSKIERITAAASARLCVETKPRKRTIIS